LELNEDALDKFRFSSDNDPWLALNCEEKNLLQKSRWR